MRAAQGILQASAGMLIFYWIILVVLKLKQTITVSWWIVCLPLYPIILFFIIMMCVLLYTYLGGFKDEYNAK